MFDKLRHPTSRKHFIAWCAVAILVSLVANYYLNQYLKPSFDATCKNTTQTSLLCSSITAFVIDIGPDVTVQFVSTSLTALFFLGILSLVHPGEEAVSDVEILFQPEQKKRHLEALDGTSFWYHDGHLASWVRKNVLPKFQKRCSEHGAQCKIKAALMDPSNDAVCNTYLSHIIALPPDEQMYNDLASIKAELCASLYTLIAGYQHGHLQIELYLKDNIDFIRDDITDSYAFWTTVGKTVPAIALVNRHNQFIYYNLALKNFAESTSRYKRVDVATAHTVYLQSRDQPAHECVLNLMRHLFPDFPDLATDHHIQRVIAYTSSPTWAARLRGLVRL